MTFIEILVYIALFIEGTVQWLKESYRSMWTYVALILGIVFSLALHMLGFNFLIYLSENGELALPTTSLGLALVETIGILMTGIILARGSNFVHDILARIHS